MKHMGSEISIMRSSIPKIRRNVASFLGLGNESSSGYTNVIWDGESNPTDSSLYSEPSRFSSCHVSPLHIAPGGGGDISSPLASLPNISLQHANASPRNKTTYSESPSCSAGYVGFSFDVSWDNGGISSPSTSFPNTTAVLDANFSPMSTQSNTTMYTGRPSLSSCASSTFDVTSDVGGIFSPLTPLPNSTNIWEANVNPTNTTINTGGPSSSTGYTTSPFNATLDAGDVLSPSTSQPPTSAIWDANVNPTNPTMYNGDPSSSTGHGSSSYTVDQNDSGTSAPLTAFPNRGSLSQKHLVEPEENMVEPHIGSNEESSHSIPSLIKRKKSSIFFEDPLPVLEASPPEPHHENETGQTSSKIERMKKKMSIFFAFKEPPSQLEKHKLSSADVLDEEDLPSFHESNSHPSHSHQPLPQGKRKIPKTRKLGVAMQSQHQVHLLSNLHLIGITFFAVSGGPFGFEPTVAAGGPGLMFLGLLLFPVLWAAPLAFMTAELSCMIPESGGHVLWVYRAFGPFWSFVNSCFAFVCSILDNAMYPVLFVEYISELFYEGKHNLSASWSIFLKVFIVALVTIINILGVDIVGLASIVLGLMVLAPLAIMCLLGLGHLNFDWVDSSKNGSSSGSSIIDWKKFVTLLLWNTSGFDAIGTCAAEVRNPSHSYPHALKVSVALIVSVYTLPTIIGVSVLPNFSEWKEGTYMIVAKLIGGSFLKDWMGVSAASSALGLLLTRLCTNSRIVYGMALVEQVPPVFSKIHPTYATPWMAILTSSLCTMLLTGFNFYSLVEADMLFYAFSTILKFSALVQLRFTEPDAFRPFRIPIDNYALAACALVPIGLCVSMIWLSSERAHGIVVAGATIAILCFIAKEVYSQYGSRAEEAMTNRLQQIQENMNKMQQRIDRVIAEEFSAPLNNLGQSIHLSPYSPPLNLSRQVVDESNKQVDVEQGHKSNFD